MSKACPPDMSAVRITFTSPSLHILERSGVWQRKEHAITASSSHTKTMNREACRSGTSTALSRKPEATNEGRHVIAPEWRLPTEGHTSGYELRSFSKHDEEIPSRTALAKGNQNHPELDCTSR